MKKERAKEIEEDLERRAFSFSLDSEGVETEPPPLSRIAEEDLDEDSDEEIARRKRSRLSLSPPSPSSRKRSSPKQRTPSPRRSPFKALSAYFGNKRKPRG